MYVFRSTLTIVIFVITSFLIFIYSIKIDYIDQKEEKLLVIDAKRKLGVSELTKVDYYILKNTKPLIYLNSEDLQIDRDNEMVNFTLPKGLVHTKNSGVIHYQSILGDFNTHNNLLNLLGDVVIKTEQSNIKSLKVKYFLKQDYLEAHNQVKTDSISKKGHDRLYIDSDQAYFWLKDKKLNFIGKVVGKIKRKRAYESGANFKSDQLYALLNQSKIELIGNVFLKKQGVRARALRAEIFMENYNKKLKYYTLFDDVKVLEKVKLSSGEYITRKAFAEKLEGYSSEQKIILTGYPKVIQGDDVIKGNKITLVRDSEIVEVDDSSSSFTFKKKKKKEEVN